MLYFCIFLFIANFSPVLSQGRIPSDTPTAIRAASEKFQQFFTTSAQGTQNYTCTNGKWEHDGPRARIRARGSVFIQGTHYKTSSIFWELPKDRSLVKATKVLLREDSPRGSERNIPWLWVQVESTGAEDSKLSPTEFIMRATTRGGVAPPDSACTGVTEGDSFQSRYSCLYIYFRSKSSEPARPTGAKPPTRPQTGPRPTRANCRNSKLLLGKQQERICCQRYKLRCPTCKSQVTRTCTPTETQCRTKIALSFAQNRHCCTQFQLRCRGGAPRPRSRPRSRPTTKNAEVSIQTTETAGSASGNTVLVTSSSSVSNSDLAVAGLVLGAVSMLLAVAVLIVICFGKKGNHESY